MNELRKAAFPALSGVPHAVIEEASLLQRKLHDHGGLGCYTLNNDRACSCYRVGECSWGVFPSLY